MRRHLLVLDMDFLAADEKLGDYAAVLLVTGRRRGSWLTRGLHLDPVHKLWRRLGRCLVVFPLGETPPGRTGNTAL